MKATPRNLIRTAVTLPISVYQTLISPLKPASCLYHPTCSAYAKEAIMRHGVGAGLMLGMFRLLRCFGALFTGGFDPVPERVTASYLFGSYRRFFRYRRSRASDNAFDPH
jgi:uncharacterized protein